MTIGERINLHRCGYTRAEIDALAAAEKEAIALEDRTAFLFDNGKVSFLSADSAFHAYRFTDGKKEQMV